MQYTVYNIRIQSIYYNKLYTVHCILYTVYCILLYTRLY